MPRSIAPAALAICAALAAAMPAAAATVSVFNDAIRAPIVVTYNLADLQTPEGAKTVASHVRRAATVVCGGDEPMATMDGGFIPCREATIDRTLATLGAPLVTAALGRGAPQTLARR